MKNVICSMPNKILFIIIWHQNIYNTKWLLNKLLQVRVQSLNKENKSTSLHYLVEILHQIKSKYYKILKIKVKLLQIIYSLFCSYCWKDSATSNILKYACSEYKCSLLLSFNYIIIWLKKWIDQQQIINRIIEVYCIIN